MTKQDAEAFQWAEPAKGWKGKNGKIIPFEEMTDAQLNKFYRLSQHKELVYANKSYVFADKAKEIEAIAKKREVDLKSLDTEYHSNKVLLRKS